MKRELTNEQIFKERRRACFAGKKLPGEVENFWDGIEELKMKYCSYCGRELSEGAQKIAKVMRPAYMLCQNCNPHPKSPL